ncbi:MAG: class I SAM-dependent methyltransferase [Planctomycetes bacterium]|nr:class I SAM-dependent methyltransferase [Planctomycetota bacterium]
MKLVPNASYLFPLLALVAAGCGSSHGHGGPLGHRFEDAEEWAPRWNDPARDEWQKPEHLVELLEIRPGMTVADLGTGTGYFLPHLSRAVGETGTVLALDIEADMIRYVKELAAKGGLANVQARVVPFDDPEIPEGEVDRVLVVNTWHHIPDREAYSKKLARSLAPGGSVAVVDFTLESEHGPPKSERIDPERVAGELRAAGLAVRVVQESLPDQYVVVASRP